MTQKSRETLQRAAGLLEGLIVATNDGASAMLEAVVTMIDDVLEAEVAK